MNEICYDFFFKIAHNTWQEAKIPTVGIFLDVKKFKEMSEKDQSISLYLYVYLQKFLLPQKHLFRQ
jgi:hypothetical protein